MINLQDEFVKMYAKRIIAGSSRVVAFETDYFYRPDIIAIDRSLIVTEYEVKLSEISLLNELKIIKRVLHDKGATVGLLDTFRSPYKLNKFRAQAYRRKNKYAKHALYIKNKHMDKKSNLRPNKFYWVLPYNLWELHKDKLARLPYGVMMIKENTRTVVVKPAKFLHEQPIETKDLWEITSSLCKRLVKEIY